MKRQDGSSYSIISENPMWWRSAIAALKSNSVAQWPYLSAWHKEWIIATVEEDILISNYMQG